VLEVALTGKTLDQAINQVHSNQNARAALDAAVSQLNGLLDTGILQVKNPEAKAQLQLAFTSLKALVDNIVAFS
jgi:NifU-like protein involved in Fe-S cluster formation